MKKIAIQKLCAILLIVTLLLALFAGCGTKTETKEKSTDSSAKTSTEEKSPASTEGAGVGSTEELYEFTLLGNITTEMKEWDNAYIKGIEDKFNLKITIEIPPSTSYTERLQMMLASGDYAEVTLLPDHTSKLFTDAVKNEVFIPLNPYLESAENIMNYTYDISWDTLKTMGDENIYGIPRTSIARADGFAVRQDWLDAVGYTDFVEGENLTLEQLEEIMTLFTKNDPDGNGVNDTYGFANFSDDLGNIDILFGPAFGLTGWKKQADGEYMDLKYSKTADNYKRALQWTQDAWKSGIIDPDWPTVKRDVSIERFKKGVSGVFAEFSGWLTDTEHDGRELVPEFELSYITGIVEQPGGHYTTANSSTGFWGLWSIANTAEQPQRIVDALDYLLSDEYWANTKYGFEGMTYTRDGDNYLATDDYARDSIGRSMLRRNNDASFFLSLQQDAGSRERIEGLIDICIEQYEFPLDKGFRPTIVDDPVYIDYEKNMKVQVSKIIVGELSVDEWDNVLAGWYAAGGEQYITEMQEYIASQN